MKNLVKAVLLLTLFTAGQACSDLLDNAQPSTSISQQVALSDPGAVKAVRAGMFDQLHSFGYTTEYMLAPDALADNLYNRGGTNRFSGVANNANGSGMMDNAYAVSYDIISDANLLLGGVKEGTLDDATLKQYQGEAYFMRALAMHHLVRSLGYEPGMTPSTGSGKNWDLGIIIRTKPTLGADDADFKPRSSVEDVYKQIESDLKKSINLLSKNGSGNPIYPTQAASEALLSRVYLYWGKYSDADQYASAALQHTSASLATQSQVATMFDETTGQDPEAIFLTNFNAPTEEIGAALNDALNVYTSTSWMAMVPTQDVMNLYSNNDARLAWFGPCFNDEKDAPAPNCLATHPAISNGSEALELKKWDGELGNYTDNVPLLRVAELKLIQAEAKMKASNNYTSGLPPLNDLRQARGLNPLVAGVDVSSNQEMMNEILDSRRREFIGEGQRFFDLKRLGMDIRKAPGISGVSDVPYFDHKVLDNFPYGEVSLSQNQAPADSALVQNPGY